MVSLGVRLALPLVLVLSTSPAYADIFSYVDGDGVVHYTNVQPSTRGWRRIHEEGRARMDYGGGAGSLARRGTQKPSAERMKLYEAYIREASALYQLPVSFLRAIMQVESNFYADVVSHKGAMGLMQLMPGTAASMGVLDAFDPRQNVLGGARYLRLLANRFDGDLVLTVAAYNAGEGAVEKYRGIPPYAETRRYVKRVLHHYYAFRSMENAVAAK